MEHLIKMDDLGVPLFSETSISHIQKKTHLFILVVRGFIKCRRCRRTASPRKIDIVDHEPSKP